MTTKIVVDAMSGDCGPQPAIAAIKAALATDAKLRVLVTGPASQLEPLLTGVDRVQVGDAPEVISMDDDPLAALRRRRSSMYQAVAAVAAGDAMAAVSAGNTGALMGMARTQLKMLGGYTRPAIASMVPCNRCSDFFCMLDLGANPDRSAQMLVDFAHMGDALHRAVTGTQKPTVGLLNIGAEVFKGGKDLMDAAALLEASELNFIGNVEANALYQKAADVVVCDGFTGNVFLKTMEGLSGMIKGMITDAFSANLAARLGALASMPVLSGLKEVMDARKYNGAAFLGLRGLVVKSHGNADEVAWSAALDFAIRQARMDLMGLMDTSSSRA